ncbi:TetR/AcrR family transcriptional regulator, partial [Actinomadura adrarensis]
MSQGPGETGILEAAIAVMTEKGYHGTSVRDIAVRAGLSPAALYYHFESKQDVLATIMERGIEELLRRTRAALA